MPPRGGPIGKHVGRRWARPTIEWLVMVTFFVDEGREREAPLGRPPGRSG